MYPKSRGKVLEGLKQWSTTEYLGCYLGSVIEIKRQVSSEQIEEGLEFWWIATHSMAGGTKGGSLGPFMDSTSACVSDTQAAAMASFQCVPHWFITGELEMSLSKKRKMEGKVN